MLRDLEYRVRVLNNRIHYKGKGYKVIDFRVWRVGLNILI